MLKRKSAIGKNITCPFRNKECTESCVLHRTGFRYNENEKDPIPFSECAINIATDCLENIVERSIGQQGAIEQTRNEVKQLNQLFQYLAIQRQLSKPTKNELEIIEMENETK